MKKISKSYIRTKSQEIPLEKECEKCGSTKNLIRHHFDYSDINFITLCRKCHYKWHQENEALNNDVSLDKKDKILHLRLDGKLYAQLKHYADRNDEGMVSISARKFLRKFLEEEKVSKTIDKVGKDFGAAIKRLGKN